MKINAQVHLLDETNSTKALASLTLENCFVITGLKIVEGKNGLFVSMPARKVTTNGNTDYKDMVYPLTKELREEIKGIVLTEYEKEKTKKA